MEMMTETRSTLAANMEVLHQEFSSKFLTLDHKIEDLGKIIRN
jgi:hypothetical protein